MRFTAIILTFLVLTFSMLPDGCAMENSAKHTQTTKKDNHKTQQNDDDCCGNCSPFYACGSCIGFVVADYISFSPVPARQLAQSFDAQDTPAILKIACIIWQPPKLN